MPTPGQFYVFNAIIHIRLEANNLFVNVRDNSVSVAMLSRLLLSVYIGR